MIEVLRPLVGELVELYVGSDDTAFDAGRVLAANEAMVVLHQMRNSGGFDGIIVVATETLRRIRVGTRYLELRSDATPSPTIMASSDFGELLAQSVGKAATIGLGAFFVTGIVSSAGDELCTIMEISSDGFRDGLLTFWIEDVESILMDTSMLKDLEIL